MTNLNEWCNSMADAIVKSESKTDLTKQVPEKAWLVPHWFNGKEILTGFFETIPRSVQETKLIGGLYPVIRIIELTPAQINLGFSKLREMYFKGEFGPTASMSAEDIDNIRKRNILIDKIIALIQKSDKPGERQAARALYTKLMGKDYQGKEYGE